MQISDIVGFTNISSMIPEEKVSEMLDRLYEKMDAVAEDVGAYKIETIGGQITYVFFAFLACIVTIDMQTPTCVQPISYQNNRRRTLQSWPDSL
jgi:class 3 adenylate cyclase